LFLLFLSLFYCLLIFEFFNAFNQIDGEDKLVPRIVVSVVYSYDVIIEAAKNVQQQFEWDNSNTVRNLVFSPHWVRGFLNRANMRRRKITTDDKKIPELSEILRIMGIGQHLIRTGEYTARYILNMDETGFTYAIGPEFLYCPPDQNRAQNIGVPNMKLRITAVVAVFASGDFAPLFIIIKHSVSSFEKPDQSGMLVIKNMYNKNKGFGVDHGWKLELWTKELTIAGVKATHKCWYIIQPATGHVITSQFKAWNDTVRMIMWLETVVKPLKVLLGKLLIWFDNCGCHKTETVDNVIASLEVKVACLPPNMTGVLQVLDLVVNGPMKAHSRKLRGSRIVACFQEYARLYKIESQKNPEDRVVLKFIPPKPDMLQGINDLFDLFANGFKDPKFKAGIVRSFINTGCLHMYNEDDTVYEFEPYRPHKITGTMSVVPTGTRNNYYDVDDSDINENLEVIQAMNDYLDYDSDDEIAMNAILNL
jgi:DDE superfamily endonuclease